MHISDLFYFYSRMNHNIEMTICPYQLENKDTMTRCTCLPFSILTKSLVYYYPFMMFSYTSLSKAAEHLSSLLFITPPTVLSSTY